VQETLDTGYRARDVFVPYHRRSQRWSVIVAHRRCGKTVACVADLIDAAIRCERPDGRFAYVAPLYNQAKDVAWTYLKKYAAPILQSPPNESELRCDLINGSRIRLYGADNPDRLRGIYLDGVVLDEYADMAPSVWGEVVRPLLSDRQGSATFIGTPKGRNAFFELYDRAATEPDWFALRLRASETNILPEEELVSARRDMTPEQYEQEFECSFEAAIIGAYFGKEIAEAERQGRICSVAPDNGRPVHTVWDLGIGDSTAIWFWQALQGEIRVVGHYESHGVGIDHYAKVIASKGWKRGDDWVPHDAKVRELGTGRSRLETMAKHGLKPRLVPDHKIMDGINAARLTLPRVWFDKDSCKDGLEALRQYRADYDEKTRAFKDTPKHDWTSHTADAFRYLAMAWREIAQPPPPKPKGRTIHEMTMDELWKLKDEPVRSTRI
jgi:phage terminase large subunit